MEVPLFLIADFANTTSDGKLNILGAFNQIFAEKFPARHSQMYVISQVRVHPSEQGKPFKMEVILMDQDGKQVFSAAAQGNVPKQEPIRDAEAANLMALAGLTFDKPGEYAFCLLLND